MVVWQLKNLSNSIIVIRYISRSEVPFIANKRKNKKKLQRLIFSKCPYVHIIYSLPAFCKIV